MRHALIEDGKVVNIIEIDPRNASDFKNAVTIPEDLGAGIGDSYRDGRFYHTDPQTQKEEELVAYDPVAKLSCLAYDNATTCTSALLEISRLAQEQTSILMEKG